LSEDSVDGLRRRLERERAARREAEALLDCKSRELHLLNRDLAQALARLESTLEERTQALVDLRTVAYLDSLTGLVNRRLFQQRLAEAVRQAEHDGPGFALLFIDTDDFKRVNDTYGHAGGDDVLRHISGRLLETVREIDTVARIAGDEFAILLPGLVAHEPIANLARRVIRAVNEPVLLPGTSATLNIGISIGIAVFPDDGRDTEAITLSADLAMYRSKQAGKNRAVFCDELVRREHYRGLELEQDLEQAVASGQFVLHYQPVLRIESDKPRMHAVEALLRWNHPRRGLLEAKDFIAFADRRGLMGSIGALVLGRALRDARPWLDLPGAPAWVAVNVSARQLRDETFAPLLVATLEETGFPPDRLALDISEAALLDSPAQLRPLAEEMRRLGVRLCLDDFGNVHAGLGLLRSVPVDVLKLAREFTAAVPGDARAEAMLESIVGLAERLDVSVLAEGVETREQLEFLQSIGCRDFQGYLFGPPHSACNVARLVAGEEAVRGGGISSALP
jgi:diguanylate cyclase (GGDEF)-like protein